jgi:hypothetical protein
MDLTRRQFLATVPALAMTDLALGADAPSSSPAPAVAWSRTVRRVGQLNMTEHDPVCLDVEAWADYWASLKVDVVLVSVTGIIAYYQTKVPFHRKGKYLGNRDFFGDCCAAAKKRGLRVIARTSPDLNWQEALDAHPDWFQRDAQGAPLAQDQAKGLFRTCMFSSYMTDYMPAILKEINSLYDVDAFYTNGWPPLGTLPDCHCQYCRNLPASGTPAYWEKFNDRLIELWKMYDAIAKEKNPANFFFANLGGGIHCAANLVRVGEICEWFQADNQGRGGEDAPIWGCSLQGRVCRAVQNGKMATNVTGTWSTAPWTPGTPRWRNVSKSPQETRMWLNETLASGMVPYLHIIGGEKGLGEDRRELQPGREYFDWTAQNDEHWVKKKSIANIGVVMGQRTQLFYKPPKGSVMADGMNGLYDALLEGRFLFDFMHEEKMSPAELAKYSALILPNTALLSDNQCAQLRDYAAGGGSLLATFETSLYDEIGQPRADFGLADVFGIHKAGDVIGSTGNAYLARIEKTHPILDSFTGTDWLPGALNRVPLATVGNPLLTVVPGYTAYPPELSYPMPSQTTEPAVVVREQGNSRRIYFPGDIEPSLWRSGHTDLSRLLQNAIRWVAGPNPPVTIKGDGVIETFAWETSAGMAIHILNYTNPAMHRGWIREFYPIGPQAVFARLPAGSTVRRVKLLRSGADIPFELVPDGVSFTIPKVVDYEVAAVYSV